MIPVGEVLDHVCPCGGDPSFEMHEQSLLHQTWLRGQARPDALDPDWSKRLQMPPIHPLPRAPARPEELR